MGNILNGNIQNNGIGFVKATIDNIYFDKIQTAKETAKTLKPVSPQSNTDNLWKNNINSLEGWRGINAVDINWNGADFQGRVSQFGPTGINPEGLAHETINTTGELIDELARLRAQIDMLTPMVAAIYESYNDSGDSGDPTPVTRTVNLICSNELYPNSFVIMVDGHEAHESMMVTSGKTVQIYITAHQDIYTTDTVRINSISNISIHTDTYKSYWYFTMPNRSVQIILDLPYNSGIGDSEVPND